MPDVTDGLSVIEPRSSERTHLDYARQVEDALPHLSVREVLNLLAEHVDNQREAADAAGDKWARVRWAADHRSLVNLADKVNN